MSPITCSECLKENGGWPYDWDVHSNNYAESYYQTEKVFNHIESGVHTGSPVSIVEIPENYTQYMKQALASGHLEVDSGGRKNYILYYPGRIGNLFHPESGINIKEERFFKAVKPETETGVHGFSFDLKTGELNSKCQICGCDLWNSSSI
ncbi:hypothetical protein ACWPKO_06990 [Coraliomargarita sp. W4R53]